MSIAVFIWWWPGEYAIKFCYDLRKTLNSGAPRARLDGVPLLSKSTHPRKFGNHVTVQRPPAVRPHHRKPMFTLTLLASLGAQERTNCTGCTSMFWSIDSYQNRASADQYHLTVPRAQVSPHRGRVLFWSYPLTNYQFQMIAGSSLFFPRIHIKYVVFMTLWPRTIRILISNWPLKRKFIQFF